MHDVERCDHPGEDRDQAQTQQSCHQPPNREVPQKWRLLRAENALDAGLSTFRPSNRAGFDGSSPQDIVAWGRHFDKMRHSSKNLALLTPESAQKPAGINLAAGDTTVGSGPYPRSTDDEAGSWTTPVQTDSATWRRHIVSRVELSGQWRQRAVATNEPSG
jgi:hypothetical protein